MEDETNALHHLSDLINKMALSSLGPAKDQIAEDAFSSYIEAPPDALNRLRP
jgi:hypothetical protein